MKKIIILFLFVFSISLYPQCQLTGTIVNENKASIQFARIECLKNKNVIRTDINGNFAITVPKGKSRLKITSPGYLQKILNIKTTKNRKNLGKIKLLK